MVFGLVAARKNAKNTKNTAKQIKYKKYNFSVKYADIRKELQSQYNFFLLSFKLQKVVSIYAKFQVFGILPSEVKYGGYLHPPPLLRANTRSKYKVRYRVNSGV